jgi:trans-aconitate 2-methyltransferase
MVDPTQARFSGRPASVGAFLAAVRFRLPNKVGARVLDLGCGTGDLVRAIKRERPDIEITGLDVSNENICVASARCGEDNNEGQKPSFVKADYCTWSGRPFDAILADGVFHLISVDDAQLAAKLAMDLAPSGILIATMPAMCAYNQMLLLQRRLWRLMPQTFDRLALALARQIHTSEPQDVLADRIGYLRVLPYRMIEETFITIMKHAGLVLVEQAPWPSPSLFKLEHRLVVFRRVAK